MLIKRTFSTSVNSNAVNLWLFIARVAVGIFMLTHGLPKLQKLLDGNVQFADPFGIGASTSLLLTVFAEVVCAFLLVLGLATRFATIPLMITMLVAGFNIHASDPFGKKEMALLYLLFFIGLFILGAGRYSVDSFIGGKGKNR